MDEKVLKIADTERPYFQGRMEAMLIVFRSHLIDAVEWEGDYWKGYHRGVARGVLTVLEAIVDEKDAESMAVIEKLIKELD